MHFLKEESNKMYNTIKLIGLKVSNLLDPLL